MCVAGVWQVCGRCVAGVWQVCGRCVAGVWQRVVISFRLRVGKNATQLPPKLKCVAFK
jgi:hypothetical protein